MDDVQDRQDVPIWNAIEAKNYKQALKLVDKRLAKRGTEYLEALKIYIRSLLPQASEKSAVLLHLEEAVARKSAISDLAAIELYEDALEEVIPGSKENWVRTIGELRWQCVKAYPKNEDTGLMCLQTCLSRDDLDHARQITNSLEKNFPNNHAYVFWNITSMYMFSISPQCPENQKKIWGGLAFGQITKLATATRQASDSSKLPIRSIHSPQELLLLDRITETYGSTEQRLRNLQDHNLGPESVIAKGDWALWRLRLKLIEEAGQWQELFDLCGSMLKRARTPNPSNQLEHASFSDWVVWEAYLKSAGTLEGSSHYDQIRVEVEAHLDTACPIDKSWKRNASLAKVELAFESSTPFSKAPSSSNGQDGQLTSRLSVLIGYLQRYGDANTAYNDLKPFVESLKTEERTEFLSLLEDSKALEKSTPPIGPSNPQTKSGVASRPLSSSSQIARAINKMKFKYLIVSSIPELERKQSFLKGESLKCIYCSADCATNCHNCLLKLAEEAIKCYQIAVSDDGTITKSLLPTDMHPADDLCVLAVICLIKIALSKSSSGLEHFNSSSTSYLLQATALLESAWVRSKSNFQISLMLIQLYSYLGCASLAMRAYQRLNLKQIQLDTLSYTVFDRISSLHPHPISSSTDDGSSKTLSLLDQLKKQQKLYRTSREHINKNTWLAFKNGSYNAIFEFREVTQRLSHSIAATMSVLESNKIHRFSTGTIAENGISQMLDLIPQEVHNMNPVLSDNNDYATFPNYESTLAPSFYELSKFIPGPSNPRYLQNLLAEKVMLIVDPSPSLSAEKETLLSSLKASLSSPSPTQIIAKTMTRSEFIATHAYHSMATILLSSDSPDLHNEADFIPRLQIQGPEILHRLKEQIELVSTIPTLVPAFQSTLNVIYTSFEMCRTALNFCAYLAGTSVGNSFHESLAVDVKEIMASAEILVRDVIERCGSVKKGLNEGGWIDRVLDSTFSESDGNGNGSESDLLGAVKEGLDDVFMEEWAGQVVESWKESIVGFGWIKMPSK